MKIFYFSGRVIPERVSFGISQPIILNVKVPSENLTITLTIAIGASQVSVKVEADRDYDDIVTLKNYVKSTVSMVVDVYGTFLNGYSYNTEITSVSYEDGNQTVFGVDFVEVTNYIRDNIKVNFKDVLELMRGTMDSHFLSRALNDLRESIDNANDTGFFAYRAIEDIRESFCEIKDGNDKSYSWKRMNNALNIEEDYTKYFTPYRNSQAHGKPKNVSGSERAELIIRGWNVSHRFCMYLLRNKTGLSINEFPSLK